MNFVWTHFQVYPPENLLHGRSSRPEEFCKKVFLELSQNSQENTSARASFLIKLQGWALQPY